MANLDTYGEYVRNRLDDWGRVFALHRDCEYLGHQSKNMLQVLIDHKGEIPPRPTGFKPLEIPRDAEQIERIVTDIARVNVTRAVVLRAFYCGMGRRASERKDTANELLSKMKLPTLSEKKYFSEHALGFEAVRWILNGIEYAA